MYIDWSNNIFKSMSDNWQETMVPVKSMRSQMMRSRFQSLGYQLMNESELISIKRCKTTENRNTNLFFPELWLEYSPKNRALLFFPGMAWYCEYRHDFRLWSFDGSHELGCLSTCVTQRLRHEFIHSLFSADRSICSWCWSLLGGIPYYYKNSKCLFL